MTTKISQLHMRLGSNSQQHCSAGLHDEAATSTLMAACVNHNEAALAASSAGRHAAGCGWLDCNCSCWSLSWRHCHLDMPTAQGSATAAAAGLRTSRTRPAQYEHCTVLNLVQCNSCGRRAAGIEAQSYLMLRSVGTSECASACPATSWHVHATGRQQAGAGVCKHLSCGFRNRPGCLAGR